MSLIWKSAFSLDEESYDGDLTFCLSGKSFLVFLLPGSALCASRLGEHAEGIIEPA
jgi:hypothetical protein